MSLGCKDHFDRQLLRRFPNGEAIANGRSNSKVQGAILQVAAYPFLLLSLLISILAIASSMVGGILVILAGKEVSIDRSIALNWASLNC